MIYALDPKQAFALPGGPDILAVEYGPPDYEANEGARHCGLYFSDASGAGRYLITLIGDHPMAPTCLGVSAVGVTPNEGTHPRILALFSGLAPYGNSGNWTYVLVWDEKTSRYLLDEELSEAVIGLSGDKETVAEARKLVLSQSKSAKH